jgi:predicted RNase H-like nuclease (RuvC/YqgF family)
MPDEVVTQAPVESANAPVEAVETAVEETPTQAEGEDVATYKKRLAGKDQALTATKKELDVLKKEADDLKRWKAEIEEKNLSEYEKAQLKIKALEDTLARQQDEARQERLARQHPLYAQFRQDTANFDEEARAAAFEKFLDSRVAEVESAPRIDPNNPRREPVVEKSNPTSAEISERLKSLGNPFSR